MAGFCFPAHPPSPMEWGEAFPGTHDQPDCTGIKRGGKGVDVGSLNNSGCCGTIWCINGSMDLWIRMFGRVDKYSIC